MKRELLNSMYDQLRLDREQKNRIWSCVEAGQREKSVIRKARFPMRAAVALGVLFITGTAAFAANSVSVKERIAASMELLTGVQRELTQEQWEIYDRYGQYLDHEITLSCGTMQLEAMLYDEYYVCMPFQIRLYDEIIKTENGVYSDSLILNVQDNLLQMRFYTDIGGERNRAILYTVLDKEMQEAGILSGVCLLSIDQEIGQGDKIQIAIRRQITEDDGQEEELLAELTVENPINNILADPAEGDFPEGLLIDRAVISPISFSFEGTVETLSEYHQYFEGIYNTAQVILMDGSVVELSNTGSTAYVFTQDGINETEFNIHLLFAAPVNPNDVKGVYIPGESGDLWIPVGGAD